MKTKIFNNERGVKHHSPNPLFCSSQDIYIFHDTFLYPIKLTIISISLTVRYNKH